MTESAGLSMDKFRILVERAGLDLSEEDFEKTLEIFRTFAEKTAGLKDIDLGSDDPAFAFTAAWPPTMEGS